MTLLELVYVAAGTALPAYYFPQMRMCARDKTQLAAYSLSKAAVQWALRAAMLPFVFGVGNQTMTWIVGLDFVGRTAEFGVALTSLLAQGVAPRDVLRRCISIRLLRGSRERDPIS